MWPQSVHLLIVLAMWGLHPIIMDWGLYLSKEWAKYNLTNGGSNNVSFLNLFSLKYF